MFENLIILGLGAVLMAFGFELYIYFREQKKRKVFKSFCKTVFSLTKQVEKDYNMINEYARVLGYEPRFMLKPRTN